MKKTEITYKESEIEQVFQKLISNWKELTEFYNKEVKFEYEDSSNRLAYIDIADISRFIVSRKRKGQTEFFETFFENVEQVIIFGDDYVKNLIVVGLFEGIQNIGGSKIDYYRSFDKWLNTNSLIAWRKLIDGWEGTDWRKTNGSQKIPNKRK